MRLLVLLFIFYLTACVTTPDSSSEESIDIAAIEIPQPVFIDESNFGEPFQVISVEQIYKLSEEQQQDFINKFESTTYQRLNPNRRIHKYLASHLKNFNYFSDTFTANETLTRDSGNCLSLAILTNALAELASVKIRYELVATPPVYQKEGGIVLGSQHIRTVLFDPTPGDFRNPLSWWRGVIKIDYFSTLGTLALRRVEKDEFHSMYYRNMAAEALIKRENNQAFWYLKKALKINANDDQAINMMAILHSRLGFDRYAENLYKHALQYGSDKLELLKNYHNLLIREERFVEAKEIDKQLLQFDDPDPYKWMNLGNAELKNKNYSSAITYYRKANKVADYLHEPYVGIAQAHYFLGNFSKAQKYMELALENTYKRSTKSIYLAKYNLLTELLNKG